MKSGMTLLGMAAIVTAISLLTACEQKSARSVRDEMREVLDQAITRLQEIPTPAAHAKVPAPVEAPAIPSRVALRIAMGKADIALFEDLLPVAQKAYERNEAAEKAVNDMAYALGLAQPELLPLLDQWVQRQPNEYSALLARGVQQIGLGWHERGTEWARHVSARSFAAMRRLHLMAAKDLNRSLNFSSRPAASVAALLAIARASSYSDQSEKLFREGIRLAPRSEQLFNGYAQTQQPKWGGRPENGRALLALAASSGVKTQDLDELKRLLDSAPLEHELKSNPRAAISFATGYTEKNNNADAWLARAGVERDHGLLDEAMKSLSRVIDLYPDSTRALEERGYIYETRGMIPEAVADYENAATKGSDYAQDKLIVASVRGQLGIPKNLPAARKRCEEYAAMLNQGGEFCMGGLYLDGLAGLPRDDALAARWFLRAARNGHAIAQHDIGWLLVQGRGVPVDREEGISWLRKSARQEFKYAIAKLEQLNEPLESAEQGRHRAWRAVLDFLRQLSGRPD